MNVHPHFAKQISFTLRTEDSTSRNLIYGYRVNTQIKLLTKTGPQKVQIHSCYNILFKRIIGYMYIKGIGFASGSEDF